MTEIAKLLVKVGADVGEAQRGLMQVSGAVQQTAGGITNLGTVARAGLVVGLAGATLAAGKSAIDMGISYESAFGGVRKTVDATEAEFAQLSGAIRQMAKEIPASREEIARVGEAAGQLGIQKEAIMGFTRTMVDLGVATNMSAEGAATQLARLANITQMSQADFGRLGSTVVDLGNNFATTEAEIVAMGMRLAGAGTTVGMTEAQILSFATALSSVGVEAEAGGTAFSRVMLNMKAEVDSGGEKVEAFARVAGVSVDEFSRRFRTDAAGAIVDFVTGLGRMQSQGGDVIGTLDELGLAEIRVRDALLRGANAGDLFTKAMETGSKAWEENTALTKEAEQRYATTASKITIAQSKFSDLGVELFERTKPALHGVIGAAGDLAETLEKRTIPMVSGLIDESNELFKVQREHNWLIQILRGSFDALGDAMAANDAMHVKWRAQLAESAGVTNALAGSAWEAADAINAMNAAIDRADARAGAAMRQHQAAADAARAEAAAIDELSQTIRINTMLAIDDYDRKEEGAHIAEVYAAATEKAARAVRGAGSAMGGASGQTRTLADDVESLSASMESLAGGAAIRLMEIGEQSGEKWVEAWGQADRAIQDAQRSAADAIAQMEGQDILSRSTRARRDSFSESMGQEELLYRRRRQDEDDLWTLEYRLARESDAERKAQLRAQYQEAQELLAYRRRREDEDREWQKGQAQKRQEFEDGLNRENMDRQRARINEEMERKIQAANNEWDRKQLLIAEETTRLQEAEKQRAREKLEAMREGYFDKLPDAAQGGIDALKARIEAAFAGAFMAFEGGGGGGTSGNGAHEPGGAIFEVWKRNEPEQYDAWAKHHGVPTFAESSVAPSPVGASQSINQGPAVVNLVVDGRTMATVVAENWEYVQARRA